jgi:hypothetical protein
MHRFRHIAVLIAALLTLAALPAVALAQSAGEDQYTDPLGQGGGSNDSGGGGSSGGGSSGSGGSDTVQPSQSQTTPAQQATPAQSNPNELPRTGLPLVVVAVSGGVLLASGAALRRRAG